MSSLNFYSDNTYFGSPNGGSSSIFVDGIKVGLLAQRGTFSCQISPGEHTVRVKRMWLASRPLTFRVASDSNANFQIDYSSSNSLTQFVSAIALPSRNLNIKLIDESEAPILTKVSTDELQSKLNYAVLVLLAGLIDAWLGLKWHSVPNEIIGALLIVSSFVASRLLKRAIRAKVRRARNP